MPWLIMAHKYFPPPLLRKTRIVCISDTHNQTPKLPKGDVLIHAGDLTNQGSYSELKKIVDWLEKTEFEAIIVIAGTHALSLAPRTLPSDGSRKPRHHARCGFLRRARLLMALAQASRFRALPEAPGGLAIHHVSREPGCIHLSQLGERPAHVLQGIRKPVHSQDVDLGLPVRG